MNDTFPGALDRQGFALVPAVFDPDRCAALRRFFESSELARSRRDGETFGARNLLDLMAVRAAADDRRLASLVEIALGAHAMPVRAIFFDKTPGANWPVAWHQDLSIAVADRQEIDGWTGWSVKRGVPHVQATREILQAMVTVRIHLDDCPAENGPLRVIPGSHAHGRIAQSRIAAMVSDGKEETICACAGDALFMKPLLLHASSPSRAPSHRRVLHLEFAIADILPPPLRWFAS